MESDLAGLLRSAIEQAKAGWQKSAESLDTLMGSDPDTREIILACRDHDTRAAVLAFVRERVKPKPTTGEPPTP
jgi:hypothetical protein